MRNVFLFLIIAILLAILAIATGLYSFEKPENTVATPVATQ